MPDPTLPGLDHLTPTEKPSGSPSGPWWLTQYEITHGAPPGLHSGKTYPTHCTCGLLVLTGYDHPRVGQLVTVDPRAATPRQEAAAIILSIPTFELIGKPGLWEITPRYYPGIPPIPRRPANQCTVVITHQCGHKPIATGEIAIRPPGSDIDFNAPPPF